MTDFHLEVTINTPSGTVTLLTLSSYCSSSKDSNGKIWDGAVVRNFSISNPQAGSLVFIYSHQLSFMVDNIGYHILTHCRAKKVIRKSCNNKGWFWLWTYKCYKILSTIHNKKQVYKHTFFFNFLYTTYDLKHCSPNFIFLGTLLASEYNLDWHEIPTKFYYNWPVLSEVIGRTWTHYMEKIKARTHEKDYSDFPQFCLRFLRNDFNKSCMNLCSTFYKMALQFLCMVLLPVSICANEHG